jgi:hypothetical protein
MRLDFIHTGLTPFTGRAAAGWVVLRLRRKYDVRRAKQHIALRNKIMARRNPPRLGVSLRVRHPETETDVKHATDPQGIPLYGPLDADGHCIEFDGSEWPGEQLAAFTLRRGMSPDFAAGLLRKLAGLVERNPMLLTLGQGVSGVFDESGTAQVEFDLEYDEFGNLPQRPKAE